MAEIECQYTGVTFTAASKRAKNHPMIADLLADANRIGCYRVVLDALKQAREDGVTDINEFRSRAKSAMRDDIAKRDAERDAERQAKRDADIASADARRERERINAHLRAHGYRWAREDVGSEDDWAGHGSVYSGVGEVVGTRWALYAPDGREVPTVRQALNEIERGADVVLAEIAAAIQAEADKRAAIAQEKVDLIARVQAATGLDEAVVDWSFDDFRVRVGAVIEKTEHFTAREYRAGDVLIGFVVKDW